MKRKILTVLMACALLLCAVPVHAAGAYIDVHAGVSKTEVSVGDTVEYVVTATGNDVVALQFEVVLPEGLTYVPGSAAVPDGLAKKLGVAAADWTESSMMFAYYNDVGIKIKEGTQLLRFSCKAEKAGSYEITLFELLPFDSNFAEFTPQITVQTLKVSAPAGETQPPVTVPEETKPVDVTEPTSEPPIDVAVLPTSGDEVDETVVVEEPTDNAETGEKDQSTQPEMDGQDAEQTDSVPEQTDPVPEPAEEKEPAPAPWIIAGAVAVAAAAAAVMILLKKKK